MITDFEAMKGQRILDVRLETDKTRIVFEFTDGTAIAFGVEGDCCSHSWIEHLEIPRGVIGATIVDVQESSMDETSNDALNPLTKIGDGDDAYEYREHESLEVYNTRFITEVGEIVLEYRNSSNGYYGGYPVSAEAPAAREPATDLEIKLRQRASEGIEGAEQILEDHLKETGRMKWQEDAQ